MNKQLMLNKQIYNSEIVDEVIEVYSAICTVNVLEDEKYIYCDFINSVTDIEVTIKEFEDYLIGLTRKYEY